ncbi:MAG: Uma2 family endonuclease [Verrucomicrobia bacterium]|nr:Uma2 family endonuclease [Verrucomicrobiota bacterium]
MRAPATEAFTVADYRAMPEGPPYYQLIEGELTTAPSPNSYHQDIAGNIFFLLRQHVLRHRLGKVCIAPLDVYLAEDTVVRPDVFFLSPENLPLLRADGVHGAPDLVVEIVSPANGPLEMKRKRPLYARCGVREEWLIEPELQQIHRYDFTVEVAKAARIVDSEESFETPLLPGLVIQAAEVFQR